MTERTAGPRSSHLCLRCKTQGFPCLLYRPRTSQPEQAWLNACTSKDKLVGDWHISIFGLVTNAIILKAFFRSHLNLFGSIGICSITIYEFTQLLSGELLSHIHFCIACDWIRILHDKIAQSDAAKILFTWLKTTAEHCCLTS